MNEMSHGSSNHISYNTYHTDVKYPNGERHLSRAITRALHRNSPRGKFVSKSCRKDGLFLVHVIPSILHEALIPL